MEPNFNRLSKAPVICEVSRQRGCKQPVSLSDGSGTLYKFRELNKDIWKLICLGCFAYYQRKKDLLKEHGHASAINGGELKNPAVPTGVPLTYAATTGPGISYTSNIGVPLTATSQSQSQLPQHLDIYRIGANSSSARRPDYGREQPPVVAIGNVRQSLSMPPYNPHQPHQMLQLMPAGSSSSPQYGPVIRSSQYGYSGSHEHLKDDNRLWAQGGPKNSPGLAARNTPAINTVPVTVILAYALMRPTVKKRWGDVGNIAETMHVMPSIEPVLLAARSRSLIVDALAGGNTDQRTFTWDLDAAKVRDADLWTDIESTETASTFPEGYYISRLVISERANAKAGAKKPVAFKKINKPFQVCVVITEEKYQQWLDFQDRLENGNLSGTNPTSPTKKRARQNTILSPSPSPSKQPAKRSRLALTLQNTRKGVSTPKKQQASQLFSHHDADYQLSTTRTTRNVDVNADVNDDDKSDGLEYIDEPVQASSSEPAKNVPCGVSKKNNLWSLLDTHTVDVPVCQPLMTAEAMAQALQLSGTASISSSFSEYDAALDVNVIMVPQKTLSALITEQLPLLKLIDKDGNPKEFAKLNIGQKIIAKGAFKTCQAAQLSMITSTSTTTSTHISTLNIVAKRPFYKLQPVSHSIFRHLAQKELEFLSSEANILLWSAALLAEVYSFLDRFTQSKGAPPFTVPKLRFAVSALAISSQSTATARTMEPSGSSLTSTIGGLARTYLLEEAITGDFVKYIHNSSPTPCKNLDKGQTELAEFLCFTQHVQYITTGGLVFISDYQGDGAILTDPQLMTNPSKFSRRGLFGDGNVSSGFFAFISDHSCNKYCEWFNIPEIGFDTSESN